MSVCTKRATHTVPVPNCQSLHFNIGSDFTVSECLHSQGRLVRRYPGYIILVLFIDTFTCFKCLPIYAKTN